MLTSLNWLLLVCGALMTVTAAAQSFFGFGTDDEEADKKDRTELDLKLPPYPKTESLIRFEVSAASNNRFYIDPGSISVGSDGIVRYTLVVRSPSGAENVSYEGMRCDMRQQKAYAFGRRDGTWTTARTSEWRYIEYKDINRQYGVLYADYFCFDGKRLLKSPKEAIDRFKYGAPGPKGSSSS